MSTVYQDVEKMLKPMSECTYMSTGMQPTLQKVYFCHDCNPSMNETYCVACIESCHYEHHISKSQEIRTYCFCGKKLHKVVDSVLVSNTKECTFWEFDEYSKNITGSSRILTCKECKIRICSYCLFFCHYHHIDKMSSSNTNYKGCECDNICHRDDRVLFYYMKDFAMFRLDNLFNTHMVNLLLEAPSTSTKLFGLFNRKMKDIQSDLEAKRFRWNYQLLSGSSGFSRSLMCLYYSMRNVNLYYFSQMREELISPKLVIELCLDNSFEDKYEVRLIKKNMLYLLYKSQLVQDFKKYNKYTSKDYSNISCIQRLNLYNAVRNDENLKRKYFNFDYNFKFQTIQVLEKYVNLCRVDDHISMALFSTILTIVKLLMQYGVYNIIQMRMINDLIEAVLKSLKLEKTSKANEEYKEMIFKKLPSLLYIMIYAYNDYVFLENLIYNYIDLKEFSIGKSNYGTRLLSSIFMSNIRYLLKYLDSKKFNKIIRLTYKSLAMLTSENDYFLKTLFNIEKHELVDFVMYYDVLCDANYNNNFPFVTSNDELFSGELFYHKKFPNLPFRNENISNHIENLMQDKCDIEMAYLDYFTLKKRSILEVIQFVDTKVRNFIQFASTCEQSFSKFKNTTAMIEIVSVLKDLQTPEQYQLQNEKYDQGQWLLTDAQLLLNKTGFHFSVIKILEITHLQGQVMTEDFFEIIAKFFEIYAQDNLSNSINVLSSCYLKYFFLHLNRFPHIILRMVYRMLKFLNLRNHNLADYSYIYDTLKDSFNCKYNKIEDGERYILGFIYHLKSLQIIKNNLPVQLNNDMKLRIKEFLERLSKGDNGIKEYFWVNNYKRRLLMKDDEYQNLINFEEYLDELDKDKKLPKEEKAKIYATSAEAKRKKMIRETRKKAREENVMKNKRKMFDMTTDFIGGNDTMNISLNERADDPEEIPLNIVNQEDLLDEPSFVTDLTIVNDSIVRGRPNKNDNNYDMGNDGNLNILDNSIRGYDFGNNYNNLNDQEKLEQLQSPKSPMKKKGDQQPELKDFNTENENLFMLENVENLEGMLPQMDYGSNLVLNLNDPQNKHLVDPGLPGIDENNFDTSMIKVGYNDNMHQELSVNNEILENIEEQVKKGGILAPLERPEDTFIDDNADLGVSDIFGNPLLNMNSENLSPEMRENLIEYGYDANANEDENYIYQINFTEQENIDLEKEIFADINEISPELFENKQLRSKNLSKNKKELIKIRKLKANERKQKLLDRLMASQKTAKAFVKLLNMINSFTEDCTSVEMQEILRKYFPRTDINKILEQRRYLKDLKLRSEIIKMLRINYLNVPIAKDKSYFDLFYLNEHDFFIKLYERNSVKNSKSKLTNIEKISQILIYELSNFEEIITPFFDSKNYDRKALEKNQKAVKYYIIDGILGTIKLFSDKVYSHGQNITGAELCLAYKIIYHFIDVKVLIDSLLEGKGLEDSLSLNRKKHNEQESDLELLFLEEKGGVDNFTRNGLFKVLYTNLNSSLEIATPQYKRSLNEVWFNLNKRMNNIGIYDGIDYLPSMLDLIKPDSMGKVKDILIINEYSKICRFYIQQSKNFRQSPLLSVFNCIVHEADFNYREIFFKLFTLTFTNERLRDHQENSMIEILNKCIEYDHERLHPIIYKYLKTEEAAKKEKLFNELNHNLLYHMIVLFVYVNRNDAYHVWDAANYSACQIVKFFQLMAKNPTTPLHDFILKHSHSKDTNLNYNFFILLEALMNKIIKLSKWGREYDLKNQIFFDNMYVIFHTIVNCLSDYAREADSEGVALVYLRIKKMIYGLKKIMYYESENSSDIIYEIKLSIMHLLSSLLEEGKAFNIVSEISFYFDPYKMFKLCVSLFKLEVSKLMKINYLNLRIEPKEKYNDLKLNMKINLPILLNIYKQEESFSQSTILNICSRIFSYIRTLKDTYKDPNAFKCFYAIKRFKNTRKGPKANNNLNKKTLIDYKYLHETGTLVDTFLEMDEITETEFVVYKFLKNIMSVIEVFSYRGKLEYVYFPRIPLTFYLHAESLKSFEDNFYLRDLSYQKIYSLHTYIHQALEECFYSHHLDSTSKFLGMLDRVSNFLYYKVIVCVINVFICIMYWAYIDTKNEVFKKLAYAFDCINLCYMIAIITLWMTVRFYPRYKQKKLAYINKNSKGSGESISKKNLFKLIVFDIMMQDFDFLYLMSTCFFCLFSVSFDFFTLKFFQLLNFIVLNNQLFSFVRFMGKHWFEIFLLGIMALIFFGSFTAMSYDFFDEFPAVKIIFYALFF